MFCPRCGEEYRRGFWRCADCGVTLAPHPPVHEPSDQDGEIGAETGPDVDSAIDPDSELVVVCVARHPALIPLVESLFASSKIPFIKQQQAMPIPYGLFPVPFLVRVQDEAAARALLADMNEDGLGMGPFASGMEDEEPRQPAPDDEAGTLSPEPTPPREDARRYDTPAPRARPLPIPRLERERRSLLSLLLRWIGGLGIVANLVLLAWASPRLATLPLHQQWGILLPAAYSLVLLQVDTIANWRTAPDASRIMVVAAAALAMLLTSASLFHLLAFLYTPDTRAWLN